MPDSAPPPPASPGDQPLPLHAAALDQNGRVLRVRRPPGRQKRARVAPDADAVAYKEEMLGRLDEAVQEDLIVKVAQFADSASTPELIQSAIEAIARELASVAWEIRQHPDSRDGERRRSRRVDGLVMLARMLVDLRRITGAGTTLRHPGVAAVLEVFLREVEAAATGAMPGDLKDTFVARVRERLVGWEDRFLAEEMRRPPTP